MNKKIIFLIVFVGLYSLASPASAAVTIPNPLGGVNDFAALFGNIIRAVSALVGGLGTIMVIFSGFLFLSSAGSPERMQKAKTALMYAIIGIAIGISGSVIANMVINAARGQPF